jgi:GNAT superfamily N-acetyltransferase
MAEMIELPPVSRNALIPMFAGHRRDRVFIDCVLEGRFGTARADDERFPRLARIDCGPFTALAGDPQAPAAKALLASAPIEWVTPETDGWRDLLLAEFPERVKRVRFTAFSSATLDVEALTRFAQGVPKGYAVERLGKRSVGRLFSDLDKQWLVDSYESLDDFLRRGIGYVALHRGRVVSAAVSAVSSSRAIDIDIETAADHRGKGLAAAVGAALAAECLVRGIEPQWLAANEASCRLATRLGYSREDTYETFDIAP